jgi:hypothetical protein
VRIEDKKSKRRIHEKEKEKGKEKRGIRICCSRKCTLLYAEIDFTQTIYITYALK